MARLGHSRRPRLDEPGIMWRGIKFRERLRLVVPIAAITASIALGLSAYRAVGASPAVPAIPQLYVSSNATFVAIGAMAHPRSEGTATLLQDGDVLIAGGIDPDGTPVAPAELYDAANATFVPDATMITPRFQQSASLLSSGKVLLAGGTDTNGNVVAGSELYDSGSDTFEQSGSMVVARSRHTATKLSDGRVLIVGGVDGNGAPVAGAEIYDAASGTFSSAGAMITPRADHSATLLGDGRVLIAGGIDASDAPLANAEIYDPSSGSFASAGTMVAARTNHTATLLQNGTVLIAGGIGPNGSSVASAEIYDPNSGTFTSTGSLNTARAFHTSTLLQDGTVLIAGGIDASQNGLANAEIYDPLKGTFALDGAMSSPHVGHSATILEDGDVLMAGGQQGPLGPVPTPVVTPTPTPQPTPSPVPAALSFFPKQLLFPSGVLIGGHGSVSKPQMIKVINPKNKKQNTPVLIEGIETTGDFRLYSPRTSCGSMITPGSNCHVAVEFAPQSTGKLKGSVMIVTNAVAGPPVEVGLKGAAKVGKLEFNPSVLDFGAKPLRQFVLLKFTIKNPNPLPVAVTSITVTRNPIEFAKFAVASACIETLAPGKTCSLNMVFVPTKRGRRTALLEITDDAAGSPQKIRMTGVGQ